MLPREKIFITAGIVFVTASLYYYLLITPIQENSIRLNNMIAASVKGNREILRLTEEYTSYAKKFASIEKRLSSIDKNFSSLTFLERVAKKSQVRDKISGIVPQAPMNVGRFKASVLEIRMEDVPLPKLVEYIYNIENSEYWMTIQRINIRTRYGVTNKFDARFTVMSYSKA